MIAACYTMDVYCTNEQQCTGHTWQGERFIQVTGETYAGCKNIVVGLGWIIKRDRQTAYCPACVKAKNTGQKS